MAGIADELAKLPSELTGFRGQLLEAFSLPGDPASWEDGEDYARAVVPAELVRILVDAFHPLLKGRVIRVLWREAMRRRDRTVLGQASVAAGKIRYFSKAHFLLVFNWTAWRTLTPVQRVALVDHELTHCVVDSEKDRATLVSHDIEEFGSIVRRYGFWLPDLEDFSKVVAATQLTLGLGSSEGTA
ncbi:MAG: hypothetical protein HOP28_13835 [Gemmatimonadales bacterium]|nr:hypothetical protein [Gemmatimonadales bacterium]